MVGSEVFGFGVDASGTPTSTPVATSTTGADGSYTLTFSTTPTGAILIFTAGGTFVSEEDSASIDAAPLYLLVPSLSPGQTIEINPLTDLIFWRAIGEVAQNESPLLTALSNANTFIKNVYGLGTSPDLLIPSYLPSDFMSPATDAGKLGLVLGAIINEDQLLCPSSPGGLITALAQDIVDGVFDGKEFGVTISYCNGNLPALAGTAMFEDALSGAFGLQLVSRAFAFGGAGNILRANGVSPSDVASSGGLGAINNGILQAIPSPVNSMTPGPPMGTPTPTITQAQDREGATATLLRDGRVLIAGGFSSQAETVRNDAVLYNSTNKTFSTVSNTMSTTREFATATLLPNGKVLIAGGRTQSSLITNTTDLFDPSSNTFTQGPNMSAEREHAAAVLLSNGDVLIAGGDSGSGALNSSDIYTPAPAPNVGTFNNGPTMSAARTALMATILSDGTALFAGGNNNSGTTLNSAEIFNPGSGSPTFSLVTNSMIAARAFGTATLLPDGNVLIAGGLVAGDGTHALKTTDLFLAQNGQFQNPRTASSTMMNVARGNMAASLTAGGTVIISGGDTVGGGAGLSSTELYFMGTDSFSASPLSLSSGRGLPTSTLLLDGQVLIAGGVNANFTTTNSTDLYTP